MPMFSILDPAIPGTYFGTFKAEDEQRALDIKSRTLGFKDNDDRLQSGGVKDWYAVMEIGLGQKLRESITATGESVELVNLARQVIAEQFEGKINDGFGIHRDPEKAREALAVAIAYLSRAKDLMVSAHWTSKREYDSIGIR